MVWFAILVKQHCLESQTTGHLLVACRRSASSFFFFRFFDGLHSIDVMYFLGWRICVLQSGATLITNQSFEGLWFTFIHHACEYCAQRVAFNKPRLSEGRVVFSTWLDTVKGPRDADHFLQWVHVLTRDNALGCHGGKSV